DVNGIKGLTGGHEEAIAFHAAETEVGALLGQADVADGRAVGRDHLHATSCSAPQVAVGVATDSIRIAIGELHELLAVADGATVDVVNLGFAGARVGDV